MPSLFFCPNKRDFTFNCRIALALVNVVTHFDALHVIVAPKRFDLVVGGAVDGGGVLAALPAHAHRPYYFQAYPRL